MKLLEIANKEQLDQLFKRQRARCYELAMYYNKGRFVNARVSHLYFERRSSHNPGISKWIKENHHYTSQLKYKLLILKFNRMIDAKERFELAGGNYLGLGAQTENYPKQ